MNATTIVARPVDTEPGKPHGIGPRPPFPPTAATGGATGAKTPLDARPLGSFEHLFCLMDRNRPVHFVLTAQVSGQTTPDDWRGALDRVQERHPLLSVGIRQAPGAVPEFHRMTPAPIPLRIVSGDPETRWQDEAAEELATPFAPGRAPLIRAVLIPGPRHAALLLAAHHSIADALSLAFVIRDLLQAINGIPLPPLPFPPSQEEALGLSHASMESGAAPREGQHGAIGKPATYRPRDGGKPKVRGLRLPENLTTKIRTRARAEGTSLHGALCAALVVAGRQTALPWRGLPVRILSPVDTRQILGVGEGCGLFLGAASHTFDAGDMGFWDLARLAKKDIAAAKVRTHVAALALGLQQVVHGKLDAVDAGRFAATAFAREAMLSNLGALPFDNRSGRVRLKSLWGPAVLSGFEGEQTIGAATVDGVLCLTQTSHAPTYGLLEAMWIALIEACLEGSWAPLPA